MKDCMSRGGHTLGTEYLLISILVYPLRLPAFMSLRTLDHFRHFQNLPSPSPLSFTTDLLNLATGSPRLLVLRV